MPELRIARILDRELNGQAVKYNHFELKNISFDEISNAALQLLCSAFFLIIGIPRINAASGPRRLLTFLSQMRRLFEGNAYSGRRLLE